MADTITIAGIQFPVATDATWKLLNPVLKEGEQVFVKDTDASTDYKIKIGDGKTKYADLKFAVDLVEARQLQTQTATKATLATTEANRSKTEADRAKSIADSVGYYTKGESDLKYSPSDLATAEGDLLDLYTAEGTMGLELLGKTIVTPTDATQPISPDNVAVIESVGELGDMKFLSCQENIWNMEFAITNDAVKVISPTTLQLNCWANQAYAPSAIKASFKPATKYFIKYKIIMVGQMSDPMQVAYSSNIMLLEERDSNNKIIGSVPLIPDIASWLKKAKEGDSLEKTGTFITTKTLDNPLLFTYSGILNSAQTKPKPTINVEFEIVSYKEELNISEYKGFVGTTAIIPLKDTTGNALEPLCSLSDGTADRLVDIEGVWNVERNICKYIFTGNELWALDTTGSYIKDNGYKANGILPVMARSSSNLGLCSTMLFGTSSILYGGTKMGCFINGKTVCARLNALAMAQDMSDCFKAGTEIIYTISPTYTPLHIDTQTALNNLQKTYAGTTIIYGTDPISPTLKATYTRPILEVIDRQIERKKLSNAIIRKAEGDILNMPTAESNMDLEILGNTVVTTRVLTFTTNSITTNGADFKFVIGDVITVAGCTTVANNKTATVVTVSADKKVLTFAPSTFTASVESGASLSTAINTDLPISPDNVAVIESVGESGAVKVQKSGKNLLRCDKLPQKFGELMVDFDVKTGVFTFNGTTIPARQIDLLQVLSPYINSGRDVTLSVECIGGDYTGYGLYLYASSPVENMLTLPKSTGKIAKTALKKANFFVWFYVSSTESHTFNNYKIRVQAEYDTTATAYEPSYPSATSLPVSIPLKDTVGNALEPLRSLPDGTVDRLVDIEGVWNVERNVAKSIDVAKCAPVLYLSDATVTKVRILGSMRLFGTTPLSNTIPSVKSHDTKTLGMVPFGGDSSYVVIVMPNNLANITALDTNTDKIAKIVTYLTSIGTEIIYAILPTYTPLHADTQTALNNLQKSYANRTIIYGTDAVAPSFKATYTADINQVITELQNAIIALGGTNV